MNTYDAAHNLAKAIRECDEYKNYQKLMKNAKDDSELKEILEKVAEFQKEVAKNQQDGKEYTDTEKLELSKKFDKYLENPKVKKFIEAEMNFERLMSDINKIVVEPIQKIVG